MYLNNLKNKKIKIYYFCTKAGELMVRMGEQVKPGKENATCLLVKEHFKPRHALCCLSHCNYCNGFADSQTSRLYGLY